MSTLTSRVVALRSGSPIPVMPIAVPQVFDLPANLRLAEERLPPITLEEDLGPELVEHALWRELFGGDLSDLSEEEDSGAEVHTAEQDISTLPISTSLSHHSRNVRLRLDCVEIPNKRRRSRSHKTYSPKPGPLSGSPPSPTLPHTTAPHPTSPPSPQSNKVPRTSQSKKNSKRREKRKEAKLSLGAKRRFTPSNLSRCLALRNAQPIELSFSATQMAAARGAHTGRQGRRIRVSALFQLNSDVLKSNFLH
ncbi:hypothetical protein VNI00_018765 [Paramarasmius palmivorus]|uniref:Uncharacterized protein n=1 Tax=Paramarasmius palmivorus TaxID=297713 RepID=A0AAW0AXR6_9AGAR